MRLATAGGASAALRRAGGRRPHGAAGRRRAARRRADRARPATSSSATTGLTPYRPAGRARTGNSGWAPTGSAATCWSVSRTVRAFRSWPAWRRAPSRCSCGVVVGPASPATSAGCVDGGARAVDGRGAGACPFLLFAMALVSLAGPEPARRRSWSSRASAGRRWAGSCAARRCRCGEREYVDGGPRVGAGDRRIMFVEVLPNVAGPVIVYATLLIPTAIVFEATLSLPRPRASSRRRRRGASMLAEAMELLPGGLVAAGVPRAGAARPPRWPSTCSATACATPLDVIS